jgi:catechol 2,3-dioxygenase-like lactoylglutathione lyase family enzyme
MPTAILATPDLDRLHAFYTGLLGATKVSRFPTRGRRPTWACEWATRSSC